MIHSSFHGAGNAFNKVTLEQKIDYQSGNHTNENTCTHPGIVCAGFAGETGQTGRNGTHFILGHEHRTNDIFIPCGEEIQNHQRRNGRQADGSNHMEEKLPVVDAVDTG